MSLNRIKFLFLTLLISLPLYSTDFYYYNGRKIQLNPRSDKIAVVLNTNDAYTALNFILQNLNPGDKLKAGFNNFYLIESSNFKSASSLNSYQFKFSFRKDIVKFVTPVYCGESPRVSEIPTDEFIVRLRNLQDKYILESLNKKYNINITGNAGDEYTFVLKSGSGVNMNALELSEIYRQSGVFIYCEPNFLVPVEGLLQWSPNDTYFSSQWALNNTSQLLPTEGDLAFGDMTNSAGFAGADMQVYKAWDYVKGNSSVLVADFDIGVDSLHPDLAGNLVTGYNAFYNNNTVTTDAWGHGTCTMGLMGAISNNGIGTAGIAGGSGTPGSACRFAAFKLSDDTGNFVQNDFIARAFDTARMRNVFVINNSWGGITPSSLVDTSISRCFYMSRNGSGSVILFAAGNDGINPPVYPSYLPFVISVGASTRHDQQKCFGTGNQYFLASDYGESSTTGDLDVVAPTICYTTDIRGAGGLTATDYYPTFSGTSAATANATGVTALIFSVNPALTAWQVKDFLMKGCDKIENVPYSSVKTYGRWSTLCGYGRVNAYNSVRLATGVDVTPPTINHTNVNSHSSTYPTLITAEILDQNGAAVPTTGVNMPKVFYRFNKNSAGWTNFDSLAASSFTGNNFTFRIPCVGYMTEVQYYIRARDNSGNEAAFPLHPNINFPYTLCYFAVGATATDSTSISGWTFDNTASISPNLTFTNTNKVVEARAKINLSHSFLADYVFLSLWSPSADTNNNRKTLYGYNYQVLAPTTGGGISNATVFDAATQYWKDGAMPWTNGSYKADYPLKGFNGLSAAGNWKFLGWDAGAGDPATFNNLTLYLRRLTGTLSSSARLNSAGDSVLYFGQWNGVPDTMSFYLKNVGTAPLTVGTVTFGGSFPTQYTLVNTPPSSIAVNDSGLFRVRFNHLALQKTIAKTNEKTSEQKSGQTPNQQSPVTIVENGIMNIPTNDPSKPTFKVSLQYDNTLTSVIETNTIPTKYNLYQNYPNPFNPVTKIKFDIPPLVPLSKGGSPTQEGRGLYLNNSEATRRAPSGPSPYSSLSSPNGLIGDPITTLKIYDITGREIQTLISAPLQPGTYEVNFNAGNLSSGIYFYQLQSADFILTNKMLLIK